MTKFGRRRVLAAGAGRQLAIELVDDSTPVSAKKFYDADAKPE